ncbi:MAG TPA: PAS domain-containing protein [Alphaproteobacteria bacterium]|nr:PAS domain-containing protein [Alphaproteobacteria bacterium]
MSDTSKLHHFKDIQVATVDRPDRLRAPLARRLFGWWQAAGAGGLPRRRDFDIVEHPQLAAHVFLVRVDTPERFTFRLLGDETIRICGRNNTGVTVAPEDPDPYRSALADYYRALVAERRCKSCTGSLDFADKSYAHFESIDCPMTDEDGSIRWIIGTMELVDAPAQRPPPGLASA